MKVFFIASILIITLSSAKTFGQDKNNLIKKSKSLKYSKFIGNTVQYFFNNFQEPVLDTIIIRDYMGITGFILKLSGKKSLYIYSNKVASEPIKKTSQTNRNKLYFFLPYKIKSILLRINGKTVKIYGNYNGRL